MSTFSSDTFTDADSTALASHTGEVGATWTTHGSYSGSTITSNRVRGGGDTTVRLNYASGTPASADYDVTADIVVVTHIGDVDAAGAVGRIDTAADTHYRVDYYEGSGEWRIVKLVAGAGSVLGTWADVGFTSGTKTAKLEMRSTSISAYVDGVLRIGPITDAAISTAGKAGVLTRESGATTGMHVDNFIAADTSTAGASLPRRSLRRVKNKSLLRM